MSEKKEKQPLFDFLVAAYTDTGQEFSYSSKEYKEIHDNLSTVRNTDTKRDDFNDEIWMRSKNGICAIFRKDSQLIWVVKLVSCTGLLKHIEDGLAGRRAKKN